MKIHGGGGSGGSGLFNPGPLLSGAAGNNNDTLAATPTFGSIIVGNATPLWSELVADGIEGHVLQLTTASGDDVQWAVVSGINFGTVLGNRVFAGPTSFGLANPTFRALVGLDMPFAGAINDLVEAASIAVDATDWGIGGTVRVTITGDGTTFRASNPNGIPTSVGRTRFQALRKWTSRQS